MSRFKLNTIASIVLATGVMWAGSAVAVSHKSSGVSQASCSNPGNTQLGDFGKCFT